MVVPVPMSMAQPLLSERDEICSPKPRFVVRVSQDALSRKVLIDDDLVHLGLQQLALLEALDQLRRERAGWRAPPRGLLASGSCRHSRIAARAAPGPGCQLPMGRLNGDPYRAAQSAFSVAVSITSAWYPQSLDRLGLLLGGHTRQVAVNRLGLVTTSGEPEFSSLSTSQIQSAPQCPPKRSRATA